MNRPKFRWGIFGTGTIVPKNWRAIGYSGNSTVTAVASRDLDRCRKFIADCQATLTMDAVPEAFGSYEELVASENVDGVYVPLPTGLRKDWVTRAAQAGKHILCEKPCAVSMAELEEMIEVCRRHRVQFMDGVMFMHNPRLVPLREKIDDGTSVGEIRRITSTHCFRGSTEFFSRNIRTDAALEPFGCLGDLGWYCIRFSLWVMKWQLPREVTGRVLSEVGRPGKSAPVPTEFSGELLYDDGVSAGFHCSFLTAREQWAVISGSKGNIHIPDYVIAAADDPLGSATTQETLMFRNFTEQALSGTFNEFWPEIALKTQKVMMASYQSSLPKS